MQALAKIIVNHSGFIVTVAAIVKQRVIKVIEEELN